MLTEIWLYRVGRNLNRAYRTLEAFGVERLVLVDCDESRVSGNLFAARDRVVVERANSLPDPPNTLSLETWESLPISGVNWSRVSRLVIGGESTGLPRSYRPEQRARTQTVGDVSGLTVEAALAIALYVWSQSC